MELKQCTRCVLDTTVNDITFDNEGICNYCNDYDKLAARTVLRDREIIDNELRNIIERVKEEGAQKKYDCIVGLSGGVDSTYVCLLAKKFGLRPLVVHFDNGWNSELAVKNIENVVNRLNFPLQTYVVDWEEFKDLQLSYLAASVVDIEVPTDHLISASLYRMAKENGIKTILSGTNIVTEGIVPRGWNFTEKTDLVNLLNIHKKYGTKQIKNFPKLGIYQRFMYNNFFAIKSVPILNYVNYIKKDVKELIQSELSWRDYGGKHYESIFTRFYQGYILPEKFKIDKRKMHLSSLICSGQITRPEALQELTLPGYDHQMMIEDRQYVLKKLGLSEKSFQEIMELPPVPHLVFGSQWDKKHFRKYYLFSSLISPLAAIYKKIKGYKVERYTY
jgi:N-acetyl sugar amidotransferase